MELKRVSLQHLAHIATWLECRNEGRNLNDFPSFGYVATHNGEPIAVGFLRDVEGGSCMLDSLCSNPDTPGDLRHRALDLIFAQLIKTAKELGYQQLVGFTYDKNTLERAIKHGFAQQPHTVLALPLTSGQGD